MLALGTGKGKDIVSNRGDAIHFAMQSFSPCAASFISLTRPRKPLGHLIKVF